jgi:hypothetical protein
VTWARQLDKVRGGIPVRTEISLIVYSLSESVVKILKIGSMASFIPWERLHWQLD